MEKVKVISAWSGIGILDLGFQTQFDVVHHVEINEHACKTLAANKKHFPNAAIWERDIFEITDEEILSLKTKGARGFIAGPSCQPFSPAKTFDPNDPRIKGLGDYLRWVRLLDVEFFVFENSFGLLQGKKKAIFDFFVKQAEQLGYIVSAKILNAHDYGSAQNRQRIIAVGVKKTANWRFEFPKPVTEQQKKYVRNIIRPGEPDGECVYYSPKRAAIVAHVPEGGHWRQLPTEELKMAALGKNYEKQEGGMTGVMRRLHRNKPCPTLVTSPCQRNTMMTHPLLNRPLSVNEYRRAMGLPDDYILVGNTAWKYLAIGNGVPFELAAAIAQAIDKSMTKSISLAKNICARQKVNQNCQWDGKQLSLF